MMEYQYQPLITDIIDCPNEIYLISHWAHFNFVFLCIFEVVLAFVIDLLICVKSFQTRSEEDAPNSSLTDKCTEFKNILLQGQLTENKIKFYTSENDDIRTAIVERFHRTLNTGMHRYFIHSKMYRHRRVTWCTRTFILITAVSEMHLSLLMLKTSV